MADITNILAMGPQPTTAWKSPLDLQQQQATLSHTQAATDAARKQMEQMQAEMERERRNIEAAKRAAAESGNDHGKYIQLLEAYGASPEIVNQTRNSIGGFMQSLQAAKDHELALHGKQNTRAANIIDSVMAIQDAQRRPVEYKRAQSQAALEGVTLPDWVSADALDIYRHGLGVEGAMAEAERLRRTQDIQQQQADATTQNADTNAQRAREAIRQNLRKAGLRENPETGEVEDIPYEELSATEQAAFDDKKAITELRGAQREAAEAAAELKRAQAANDGPKMQLAQDRINTAKARLALSQQVFDARYRGVVDGQPIPGAMIADNGAIVPPVNSQNVRPTGTQRRAADMANSADEQLQTIEEIIKRRPDIFGPVNGRYTDFTQWLGSQDPDAKMFVNARTIAADHLAGVFGGRSEGALHELNDAIGQFRTNPEAMQKGLSTFFKANKVFQKAGTPRTVGSAAAGATQTPQSGSLPVVASQEAYDRLKKGDKYKGPDGVVRVKQ